MCDYELSMIIAPMQNIAGSQNLYDHIMRTGEFNEKPSYKSGETSFKRTRILCSRQTSSQGTPIFEIIHLHTSDG